MIQLPSDKAGSTRDSVRVSLSDSRTTQLNFGQALLKRAVATQYRRPPPFRRRLAAISVGNIPGARSRLCSTYQSHGDFCSKGSIPSCNPYRILSESASAFHRKSLQLQVSQKVLFRRYMDASLSALRQFPLPYFPCKNSANAKTSGVTPDRIIRVRQIRH
jgi:hypothetical protein